jgi:hypothetical protein
VRVTEPAGHAYPASHGPLQEGVDRAGSAPNRPAGHSPLQSAVPSAVALPNRPVAHTLQLTAPGREYVPAGQTDAVALVEPGAHAYPAVHMPLQAAVFKPAVVALNQVPAGQLLHDPAPARLYRPGGHIDAVALVEPTGHTYPAVHRPLHTAEFKPAVAALNQVPEGQLLHAPAPARLYRPGGQMNAVALVEPTGHA